MDKEKIKISHLLLILIGVAALVLVFVLVPAKKQSPPVNPLGVEIPDEVFSYIGEVTKVSGGALEVKVFADRNYLEADADIKVLVGENTELILVVADYSAVNEGKEPVISSEPIEFSIFSEGDEVLVESGVNIRDKKEFTASAIRLFETITPSGGE